MTAATPMTTPRITKSPMIRLVFCLAMLRSSGLGSGGRPAVKQVPHPGVGGVLLHLPGIAVEKYAPGGFVQHDHPVGDIENGLQFVGDNYHSGSHPGID